MSALPASPSCSGRPRCVGLRRERLTRRGDGLAIHRIETPGMNLKATPQRHAFSWRSSWRFCSSSARFCSFSASRSALSSFGVSVRRSPAAPPPARACVARARRTKRPRLAWWREEAPPGCSRRRLLSRRGRRRLRHGGPGPGWRFAAVATIAGKGESYGDDRWSGDRAGQYRRSPPPGAKPGRQAPPV